jgi:hypothetical protein
MQMSGGCWPSWTPNKHQDVAARYGIRTFPASPSLTEGESTNSRRHAEAAVLQWLERALPDPHRKEIGQADRF